MNHRLRHIIQFSIFCYLSFSAMPLAGQTVEPVINKDNSVTFTFVDSDADDVYLYGSFIPDGTPIYTPVGYFRKPGKHEMVQSAGVWTYTTKPLRPDIYTYYFDVDDEQTLDPSNNNVVRDGDEYLNYFMISGGVTNDYIDHDVPHGMISKVWYDSSLPNVPHRRMIIYTPPQYKTNKQARYPVLYLLHGSGGDEYTWSDLGRSCQILDNLIAQGRCVPMIVVMPNGNANKAAAPVDDNPYLERVSHGGGIGSMLGYIENSFVQDIVNYVDSHYRVIKGKQGRAIAGASMGGLHALYISANNPDVFDYVGLFSAQTTTALMDDSRREQTKKVAKGIENATDALPFLKKTGLGKKATEFADAINGGKLEIYDDLNKKLETQFNNPPRLYYIALGRNDFLKDMNDDFRSILDKNGYKYVYNETDGGHSWENWRRYLLDFLPRLFKK